MKGEDKENRKETRLNKRKKNMRDRKRKEEETKNLIAKQREIHE